MHLANIFQEGMVLQQNQNIRIWGKGEANTKLEVCLKNNKSNQCVIQKTKSDTLGKFICELPPIKGGYDSYTLTLSSRKDTQIISDIVIGELYLTSGQSNMAYPVSCLEYKEIYIKKANNFIRFVNVDDEINADGTIHRPYHPQEELHYKGWLKSTSSECVNCSAVGYVFATELQRDLNVPIGLINTSVGGSSIDSWLSHETIEHNLSVKNFLVKDGRYITEDKYHQVGQLNYTVKAGIYNEKIAPLMNLTIAGILWYQGENSVKDFETAKYYKLALEALVKQYRKIFKNKQIPIVISHIALNYYPYATEFAVPMINEAISLVSEKHQFVYEIPIYDVHPNWLKMDGADFWNPIHPITKSFIGLRMAKTLYKNYYLKTDAALSPTLNKIECLENKIILSFNHVFEGLKADQQTIYGFTIAANDQIYHDAQAKIINQYQIEVSNEHVKNPKDVTYAYFLYNEICNVKNSEDYPLVPFRTSYDSAKKAKYYSPDNYLYCETLLEFENNFFPQFGGAYFKPCWNSGNLNNFSKIHLSLNEIDKTQGNSSLKVDYELNHQGMNYVGVSPIINYVGHHHHFENYSYLSLDLLNCNEDEVTFIGVLVKSSSNDVYLLPVVNETYLGVTLTQNRFTTYTISLRKAYQSDTCLIDFNDIMLKSIVEIQLTFLVKENGSICVDNLRLHC